MENKQFDRKEEEYLRIIADLKQAHDEACKKEFVTSMSWLRYQEKAHIREWSYCGCGLIAGVVITCLVKPECSLQ